MGGEPVRALLFKKKFNGLRESLQFSSIVLEGFHRNVVGHPAYNSRSGGNALFFFTLPFQSGNLALFLASYQVAQSRYLFTLPLFMQASGPFPQLCKACSLALLAEDYLRKLVEMVAGIEDSLADRLPAFQKKRNGERRR